MKEVIVGAAAGFIIVSISTIDGGPVGIAAAALAGLAIGGLVYYVLGYDNGYAKGRRDESIEHARVMREMQRAEWRREAARKRMEEAKNGEKHRTAAGD